MRLSESIYELCVCLMILLSIITLASSTQQYYKLDGKANNYKNTYKTRQLSPYLRHTGASSNNKNNNNEKNNINLKQFAFDDSNYQYYYYDKPYSYSYSYSMQIPQQWYSYSYSYYYSIVYIETEDHTTDDDSIKHNDNYQGIIKFFIAGFVTITFIYFYRSYHSDKKKIQESGYEMVNVLSDLDDSNLDDDDDDDINEKITRNKKSTTIKDSKYISVNTKEDS